MTRGYIYVLTSPSGKHYIGQTWDWISRMSYYRNLRCKDQPRIYNAIKKYGFENFTYYFISSADTQEILDLRERYWIDMYDSRSPEYGYNIKEGGSNGKHSEATKAKLHDLKMGHSVSQETRDIISKHHKGRKPSLEWIKKAKEARTLVGREHSEETKQKIRQANTGHLVSETTKQKLSQKLMGRTLPEDIKQKVVKNLVKGGFVNHTHSEETKEKMRLSICKYTYTLTSPTGEVFTVKSLNKFCKEHNLILNCILVLIRGKQKQHRGWTATRILN